MSEKEPKPLDEVIQENGRYPPEAFAFLHEALARAVEKVHGEAAAKPGRHHVSGEQICEAVRELAHERWGMLAPTVLATWNICETIDFGRMVYLLIEHGHWNKTEDDSIEDFADVFDLSEAFREGDDFRLDRDRAKDQ